MSAQGWSLLFGAIQATVGLITVGIPFVRYLRERYKGAVMTQPWVWSRRKQIVVLVALIISTVCNFVGLYLSRGYDAYPPFRKAYHMHKKELGNPLERGQPSNGAQEEWYERAVALWIKDWGWAILPIDSHDSIERDDIKWVLPLRSEGIVKEKIENIPPGKNPPLGGIAILWLQDRQRWERVRGYLDEDCGYDPMVVYFQKFENGTIIGPVRRAKGFQDAVYWVLIKAHDNSDTGKRYWEPADKALPCVEVVH